ncbi:unnamed protein product [Pleuronectes platessa]|uniref:Uncharacterized protein n=1 Tax=Pleuronectes platessa TaxID=8262 RepID=A0A9N7Y819_PLEPL|nr:unnamed protein product [Pleuronectes platessa]
MRKHRKGKSSDAAQWTEECIDLLHQLQEELHDEDKAGGEVEQEQNPVGQQGDPRPGEAALPDAMGPCYHVESNVAVKNEQSTERAR